MDLIMIHLQLARYNAILTQSINYIEQGSSHTSNRNKFLHIVQKAPLLITLKPYVRIYTQLYAALYVANAKYMTIYTYNISGGVNPACTY